MILACGGFSYASTGSDGAGYILAKQAGHKIKSIEPSLVPFEMKENWCKELMGLTLKNVMVRIKTKKKTIYEGFGEFLFTHFGVSGACSYCKYLPWQVSKGIRSRRIETVS